MPLIAVIQNYVKKNNLLEEQEIIDAIFLASVLPGPMAFNVVVGVGYRLHDIKGALVCGLGVILPTFILVVGLSVAYFHWGQIPVVERLFMGFTPAMIAIVISAAWSMARKTIKGVPEIVISLAACAVLLGFGSFYSTIGIVLGSGLAGWLLFRNSITTPPEPSKPTPPVEPQSSSKNKLLSLFDDMLFLNVVRDPRAQVSSINRAIIHDFDSLLSTITWVKAHDAGKALAEKYPDKVLTVRYEDFLSNQETVIRKICEFFGIEFLTSMLDVSASQEAQKLSVLSALWKTNICPPIPAYIDKFKKCLSTEEIELIETLAGNHMDYYGYEKLTKARANITEEMIERAKEGNEFKKREAWMNLKETGPFDYQLRRWRRDYLNMVKERLQQNKTEVLSRLDNNIQQSA